MTTENSFDELFDLPSITVRKRSTDWIAHLTDDTKVRECADSKYGAVVRLALRLMDEKKQKS